MITRMMLTGLTVAVLGLSTAAMAQDGPEMGPMPLFDFAAMDADKDGKITQSELTAFRTAKATAADTNADGKLDQSELVAMQVAMMTDHATDRAARMIDHLDTDGDAALSIAEMAAKPMHARLFDRIDADRDGAITEVEVDAARAKMAERMASHGGRGMRGFWGAGHN